MVDIQGLQLESPHFVCVDSDDWWFEIDEFWCRDLTTIYDWW
jgi:hypothetical protein